jgi:hypothetical protein
MSNGFQVQLGELHSNAGAISGVAGQVSQAAGAAGAAMGLSPQAFGILCSFFTPPALALSSAAIAGIGGLQSGATKRAGSVEACAADFEATDTKVAEGINRLRGTI